MSSPVEQIKERISIEEVIGSYITVERAGGNFKAKCPFHNEKTPSFFISPARGTYYCFGCGAKGDIFTFVQEFEGLEFADALRQLAERTGVKLTRINAEREKENEELFKLLERATSFFEEKLSGSKEAKEYLKKRGLLEETISAWRLGYALDEWRALNDFLKSEGVSEKLMLSAGLIKKPAESKKDDLYYDVFRDRIMFPIALANGKIAGFSGRILHESDKAPKYVNSPETAVFRKSEILYGLDKAKGEIRRKDYSILVEGQMDLLMAHQAGFTNTVASSGTAFTEDHLQRLARISNRILMAFDADGAGFMAARRSAELALQLGMEVKIAALPAGTDPAELIRTDLAKWKDTLRGAKHIIDFYLDALIAKGVSGRDLAREVKTSVLHLIDILPSSIDKSHFVSQVAKKTGLREDALWQDLKREPSTILERERDTVPSIAESTHRKDHILRKVVGIILWQEGLPEPAIDHGALRKRMLAALGKKDGELLPEVGDKEELIFEAESYYGDGKALPSEIEELMRNMEEDVLREKFVEAMRRLQRAEEERDEKTAKKILEECQEITKRLSELTAAAKNK